MIHLAQLRADVPRIVVQKVRECVDRCVGLLNVAQKFLANALSETCLLLDILLEVLGSVDLDDSSGSHISGHFVCLLSCSTSIEICEKAFQFFSDCSTNQQSESYLQSFKHQNQMFGFHHEYSGS